jgi:hypothetical protein
VNGGGIDLIKDYPFVLSLSKHGFAFGNGP